jgi:hypothetical protein
MQILDLPVLELKLLRQQLDPNVQKSLLAYLLWCEQLIRQVHALGTDGRHVGQPTELIPAAFRLSREQASWIRFFHLLDRSCFFEFSAYADFMMEFFPDEAKRSEARIC